jgi:hypothetical protein
MLNLASSTGEQKSAARSQRELAQQAFAGPAKEQTKGD